MSQVLKARNMQGSANHACFLKPFTMIKLHQCEGYIGAVISLTQKSEPPTMLLLRQSCLTSPQNPYVTLNPEPTYPGGVFKCTSTSEPKSQCLDTRVRAQGR